MPPPPIKELNCTPLEKPALIIYISMLWLNQKENLQGRSRNLNSTHLQAYGKRYGMEKSTW